MNEYTVVVTIGRNIGDNPMPIGKWSMYLEDVRLTLKRYGGHIVQAPASAHECQRGVWEGVAGEDAATFVSLSEFHGLGLEALRREMNEIRRDYHQEAIGFIAVPGHDHLIGG